MRSSRQARAVDGLELPSAISWIISMRKLRRRSSGSVRPPPPEYVSSRIKSLGSGVIARDRASVRPDVRAASSTRSTAVCDRLRSRRIRFPPGTQVWPLDCAMSQDPGRWVDRVVGWCFCILLGVIALYCAVWLLESMLPTLMLAIGVLTLIGLPIGAFVVFSTMRNKW